MSDVQYTYYGFDYCIGGYFEMATSEARKVLPSHLEPLEKQHERSIFAITVFRFTESEVGAYDEVVLAVVVPPMVEPGKPLPKAAMYPFMVGTSTRAAREHAMERWHLPHVMKDLDMDFQESDGTMTVRVRDDATPVLDLVVTEFEFEPARNQYNVFTIDGEERFKVDIYMEAPHSEHEEERGELTLHDHPLLAGLDPLEIERYPFREEWYQKGLQTFEELESI
ncbi:MAG: hypothetical protein U5R14_15035 [Gemmatimonadota bacterium]|nr:hypothetical protein [Gemmatimonadota bacterium]